MVHRSLRGNTELLKKLGTLPLCILRDIVTLGGTLEEDRKEPCTVTNLKELIKIVKN